MINIFEEGLRTLLFGIFALVDKVYPIDAPEGTKGTYITYKSTSTDREHAISEKLGALNTQYELNLYCDKFSDVKTIKQQVITILRDMSLTTVGGVFIQQVEIITDFEYYESEVKKYKAIIEFEIYVEE